MHQGPHSNEIANYRPEFSYFVYKTDNTLMYIFNVFVYICCDWKLFRKPFKKVFKISTFKYLFRLFSFLFSKKKPFSNASNFKCFKSKIMEIVWIQLKVYIYIVFKSTQFKGDNLFIFSSYLLTVIIPLIQCIWRFGINSKRKNWKNKTTSERQAKWTRFNVADVLHLLNIERITCVLELICLTIRSI